MKVMDNYDFDENNKERYKGTIFLREEEVGVCKGHGYSYVFCRQQLQDIGQTMGLERELEI